jgi:hypothetical protein
LKRRLNEVGITAATDKGDTTTIEESRSVGSQTESDLHLLAFKLTFRHNTSITAEPDQHMKQRKLTYYVALRLAKAELL